MGDRIWVCFLNDDDTERSGYFELVQETDNFIKIKSSGNIITLPYHRIKKIKKAV